MAVVDVKLVSGYQVDEDSLKRVSLVSPSFFKESRSIDACGPLFSSSAIFESAHRFCLKCTCCYALAGAV